MLDALRFVQGAVAKKDLSPALTHFRLAGGRALGYNGLIALSSPIDIEVEAAPDAKTLVRAIERCKGDTTVVHLTDGGALSLKSGRFQAYVECYPDPTALAGIEPEGEIVEAPPAILQPFEKLLPLVGDDLSKPWAAGILLYGRSAFATNNVVLAEYWLGYPIPKPINIPGEAVREILRIGIQPTSMQVAENSVTFHYPGERWLRARLYSVEWPNVVPLLEAPGTPKPLPDGFFEALATLKPFLPENSAVYFRAGRLQTRYTNGAGASVEIEGLPDKGAFNGKLLLTLDGLAHSADFTPHPKPCPFRGDNIRGVLIGMYDA